MGKKFYSDLISTVPGFQYSVNIKYDLKNPEKVASYIPLSQSVEIIKEILLANRLERSPRARLIAGSYGTGKSHLCTVILSVLSKALSEGEYLPLIKKIELVSAEVVKVISEEMETEKVLPVVVNGNGNNIEQSLLAGLQLSLNEAKLTNLMPSTFFDVAKEQIDIWRKRYKAAYSRLCSFLASENVTIGELTSKLSCYDTAGYKIFERAYSEITHGAVFQPLLLGRVEDIYIGVAKALRDFGYKGIIVLFDEFGKYLESKWGDNESLDLKPLQDFAEACNSNIEHGLQIVLITHKSIAQYASRHDLELVNEWKKVEGRFKTIELINQPSKVYEIMSQVIIKQKDQWQGFRDRYAEQFKLLQNRVMNTRLFSDLTEPDFVKYVLYGSFPIHPIAAFCLPRFAQRVAQNERTLFTFLATNDFNTLGHFIKNSSLDEFNLLTLDTVYDYFESQVKELDYNDIVYQVWLQTCSALSRLTPDEANEARLLKGLAIIKGLGLYSILPPTQDFLRLAFTGTNLVESEFVSAIQNLYNKKILFEGLSTGNLEIIEAAEIDVENELNTIVLKRKAYFDLWKSLNGWFCPKPVLAKKYNDEYSMTRYFTCSFISFEDFITNCSEVLSNSWDKDGFIYYVLCTKDDQEKEIINLLKQQAFKRVIVVMPGKFSEIYLTELDTYLRRIDGLKTLIEGLHGEKHRTADRVEVSLWIKEVEDKINRILRKLFNLSEAKLYYSGKKFIVKNKADLSKLVSNVCYEVFSVTPKFNNEMINKHNLSSPIINARKKVINGLLQHNLSRDLGLTGTGPEMAIYRSLIRHKGIIVNDEEAACLNDLTKLKDSAVHKSLKSIETKLIQASDSGITFDCLLKTLCSEPFGIRRGIIPILLAIFLHGQINDVCLINNEGSELAINAETLEAAFNNSQEYVLVKLNWSESKALLCTGLEQVFFDYVDSEPGFVSPTKRVVDAMRRWFLSLPRFTRDSRSLSIETKEFRRLLKGSSSSGSKLLFEQMPTILGVPEVCKENVELLVTKVKAMKVEMDSNLSLNLRNLEKKVNGYIPKCKAEESLLGSLKYWYGTLSAAQKERLYSDGTQSFIDLISSCRSEDNLEFMKKIFTELVGLRPEDWNDSIVKNIPEIFKQIVGEVESYKEVIEEAAAGTQIKISFEDIEGNHIKRSFIKTSITPTGELLQNVLEAIIDEYGDAITNNEKRQIVLTLLEKLIR